MATESSLLIDHSAIPAARSGFVLVAIGKGGPRELGDYRLSLSERLFGKYSFVEVDVSEKVWEETVDLPSRTPGIAFNTIVRVTYRISDPVEAVRNAVKLARDLIKSELLPALEAASRQKEAASSQSGGEITVSSNTAPAALPSTTSTLGLDDVATAEQNVVRACADYKRSKPLERLGIEIRTVSAKLSLGGEAGKLAATIGLAGLKIGAQKAAQDLADHSRTHQESILAGGPRKMFAEMMRANPGAITNLLEQFSSVEQNRYQNDINLLKQLLEDGHIESHHIPTNIRDEFLQNVLNRATIGDVMLLGTSAKKDLPKIQTKSTSD